MAKLIFPSTKDGETQALAVPEPKNVIFDGVEFVVLTGGDYVPPPVNQ